MYPECSNQIGQYLKNVIYRKIMSSPLTMASTLINKTCDFSTLHTSFSLLPELVHRVVCLVLIHVDDKVADDHYINALAIDELGLIFQI